GRRLRVGARAAVLTTGVQLRVERRLVVREQLAGRQTVSRGYAPDEHARFVARLGDDLVVRRLGCPCAGRVPPGDVAPARAVAGREVDEAALDEDFESAVEPRIRTRRRADQSATCLDVGPVGADALPGR